jgi:hypothetical protein
MLKKMLKKIWNALGTPQVPTIITIIAVCVAILFGVLNFPTTSQTVDTVEKTVEKNSLVPTILFIILILATIVNIVFHKYYKTEKFRVISILSALQNKYILDPEFKTSGEHGDLSKEKNLTMNGKARILTNSLKYDIYFCKAIADNILGGAKYTYIIPRGFQVFTDLQNYIAELYNQLNIQWKGKNNNQNVAIAEHETLQLFKTNLDFLFFTEDVLCLYNFARFNQIGNPNFMQSWWYVNPKDNHDDSYMLSKEIEDVNDQQKLNSVFTLLEKISTRVLGDCIYTNRDDLQVQFGER